MLISLDNIYFNHQIFYCSLAHSCSWLIFVKPLILIDWFMFSLKNFVLRFRLGIQFWASSMFISFAFFVSIEIPIASKLLPGFQPWLLAPTFLLQHLPCWAMLWFLLRLHGHSPFPFRPRTPKEAFLCFQRPLLGHCWLHFNNLHGPSPFFPLRPRNAKTTPLLLKHPLSIHLIYLTY